MASENQSKYITDLAVKKTKEFKEVKEMLFSSGIVEAGSETIKKAQTIAEINAALTDLQASKFIDVLVATSEPKRSTTYSANRAEKTANALESIISTINGWKF